MEELRGTDPRRIGPYEIVGVLGSGGMGRVYLGRTSDGVAAAVKVIHADLARDPEFRRRFRREVETTAAITGPRLAAVLDSDVEAEHPWLATEYVAGPSLAGAVADSGPLSPETAVAVAAGVAEALAAIHAQGLVHRDVKPSNVLLAADGPRLIDFGIARGAADSRLTRTGVALGTPQFMAPEQIQGTTEVDGAADLFALGGVLLYAMTGEYPFGEGSAVTLLYRIVHETPRLDLVPPDLRPLLAACLDKDPAARPTAAEVAQYLGRLADPGRTVEVATRGRRRAPADATTDRLVPLSAMETQAVERSAPDATTDRLVQIGARADAEQPTKDRRKPIAIGAGVLTGVAALITAVTLSSGGGGSQGAGSGKIANEIPNQQSSSLAAGAGVILPNGSTSTPSGSQSSNSGGPAATTAGNPTGSAASGSAPGSSGSTGAAGLTSASKPGAPASASSGTSQPQPSGSAPTSHGSTTPPASASAPSSPATSSSTTYPPPARTSSLSGTHALVSAYDSHCVNTSGSKYTIGSCSGGTAAWKVWQGATTSEGFLPWQFESTSSPGYCMNSHFTAGSQNGPLVPCSASDSNQWWYSRTQPAGRQMILSWNDSHYCLLNHGGSGASPDDCTMSNTSGLPDNAFWWTIS